jgi:hypothetical protein
MRDADAAYFDQKHDSKLVVIDDCGYGVAVADDAGIRTDITALPPPETLWSPRVDPAPRPLQRA